MNRALDTLAAGGEEIDLARWAPDGARAVVRSLTPDDGPALREGLRQLSSRSVEARFFYHKRGFSDSELARLTHCDGQQQCGLIAALVDADGREFLPLAVARWVRDAADQTCAEAGIVVCDLWHNRGLGSQLLQHLADKALAAGVVRFRAVQLASNNAARRIFGRAGNLERETDLGCGVVELLYRLRGQTHTPAWESGTLAT